MTQTADQPIKSAERIAVLADDMDARFDLGEDSKKALRGEQIRALHNAQMRVEAAFLEVGVLTDPEARATLEELGAALCEADRAVSVLWWLAPANDDSEED